MKIIVDGFGGDNAPIAVLEGCAAAVKEYGVQLIVTGDEAKLRKAAAERNISLDGIEIFHAPTRHHDARRPGLPLKGQVRLLDGGGL